jgi:hypothetical protein
MTSAITSSRYLVSWPSYGTMESRSALRYLPGTEGMLFALSRRRQDHKQTYSSRRDSVELRTAVTRRVFRQYRWHRSFAPEWAGRFCSSDWLWDACSARPASSPATRLGQATILALSAVRNDVFEQRRFGARFEAASALRPNFASRHSARALNCQLLHLV